MKDADLIKAALAGERHALSRLLTRVERGGASAEAVLERLYPGAGASPAHVIGVTGAPGTGKSTLVSRLAQELRRRKAQVAIVAVDPSSPFSGGALLGDRVRMAHLAGDDGIFVRSMASRGATGGLAEQTAATVTLLAAAGFDAVLIETVGAGQGELEVAEEAQSTLVVTAPGLGDGVQALKAGIVEIADVLVVNKADHEGADRLVAELTFAAAQGRGSKSQGASGNGQEDGVWIPAVLKTVATTGQGVHELVDAAQRHRVWLETSGAAQWRARALAERQILRWAAMKAWRRVEQRARASGRLQHLVGEVMARRLSPPAAADDLLRLPPGGATETAAGEPAAAGETAAGETAAGGDTMREPVEETTA